MVDLNVKIKATDETGSIFDKLTEKMEHYNKSFATVNKQHKVFKEFAENSGVARVGEGIKGLGEHLFEMGKSALEAFGILGGIGSLLSVSGFVEATKQASESGKELILLAQATNTSVGEIQAMKIAAQETGVEMDFLATSYQRFARNIAEARLQRNGPMATQLLTSHIGLDFAAANPAAAMEKLMTNLFKNYGTDSKNATKRYLIETDLFGRGGPKEDAALQKRFLHGDHLIEQVKHEKAVNEEGAKTLQELNEKYESLARIQANLRDAMTVAVAPGMGKLLESLSELLLHSFPSGDGGINGFLVELSHRVEEVDHWLNVAGEDGRTGWKKIEDGVNGAVHKFEEFLEQIGGVGQAFHYLEIGAAIAIGSMAIGSLVTIYNGLALAIGGVTGALGLAEAAAVGLTNAAGGGAITALLARLAPFIAGGSGIGAFLYTMRPYETNKGEDDQVGRLNADYKKRHPELFLPSQGGTGGISGVNDTPQPLPGPLPPEALNAPRAVEKPKEDKLDITISMGLDGTPIVTRVEHSGSSDVTVRNTGTNNPMGDFAGAH